MVICHIYVVGVLKKKKMVYIKFNENLQGGEKIFEIRNLEGEFLGQLEKIKVGRWASWCLVNVPDCDIYFSASCLDTIREKIKELNSNYPIKAKR